MLSQFTCRHIPSGEDYWGNPGSAASGAADTRPPKTLETAAPQNPPPGVAALQLSRAVTGD